MFAALEQYLAGVPATETHVWLTLNEIEALTGAALPAAATRAAYWSRGHAHARETWLRHGFVASLDRRAAAVCFARRPCVDRYRAPADEPRTPAPAVPRSAEAPITLDRGKYAPLIRLLRETPPEQEVVQLTSAEIEAILGEPLPASAFRPGYWTSPGLNASRAWKRLGFIVRLDRECRRVLFIRKAA
ncbi:MAG TPA: hypothetical protein VFD32_08070 [Dehalococcoidia bacterium]|nr:hypothetical protein [Dehalococcoidia bacterium]